MGGYTLGRRFGAFLAGAFFCGGEVTFSKKTRFLMFWGKNGPKMIAIIQTIGKNGTLDPIQFWLVP